MSEAAQDQGWGYTPSTPDPVERLRAELAAKEPVLDADVSAGLVEETKRMLEERRAGLKRAGDSLGTDMSGVDSAD